MRYFLLHILGDIEPVVVGPFKDAKKRDEKAREIKSVVGDEDGIFKLDVPWDGRPRANAYSRAFFHPEELPIDEK